MADAAKHFKWYHWAGGLTTVGAVNGGILWGMTESYHWFFADAEDKQSRFMEKYGQPTQRQKQELFTWLAPNYDEGVKLVETGGADNYRRELLKHAAGDILEVGVGTGRCFEALDQAEVRTFVGVDLNDAMLRIAKGKLSERSFDARVVRADAHRLPFPDKSFDTVIGSLCLCSVERPAEVLDEMVRVCRPKGMVLLVEPGIARRWLVRIGQRYLGLVPNPKHAWEFGWRDDNDVQGLIGACNDLEVDSIETRAMGNWYLVSSFRPE